MTNSTARDTYLTASVSTASPEQMLIMLYERLVLDLERATDALRRGEPSHAHQPLLHAQEVVLELRSSLKVDVWEGGPALASLYDYLHHELVRSNVAKDLKTAEFCKHIVSVLRDSWRDAFLSQLPRSA